LLEIAKTTAEWEKIGYLKELWETKYKLIEFWSSYFWIEIDAIEVILNEEGSLLEKYFAFVESSEQ
jgi:hypothetical protein